MSMKFSWLLQRSYRRTILRVELDKGAGPGQESIYKKLLLRAAAAGAAAEAISKYKTMNLVSEP